MGIIADTHVFGSRKGYECLSKSPGVAAAEDAVLSEFGFGQCSDERYLAGLAASATAFGRSLPGGRMAITRVIRGPVDDGGRPTHEQRTLIVSAADYQVLRHSLSRLVNDQSVWSSASFAAGRTIALPPSAATSGPPGPRDWQIFDAWVLGKDQEKAVVVGDDDQSAEAVMALAGRLTNADALTYRWGVRMLAAITWVDAITLSRFGVLDGRRAVHGVSQGACIHPKVQEAYRARPNQLPALAALQQATAIEQEPFGLEVIDEEIPSNVTSAPAGVAVRQRPRRVSSYVWVAATAVSVVCLGFASFFALRHYDAGRRQIEPPADPQRPTSDGVSGNGQGAASSAESPSSPTQQSASKSGSDDSKRGPLVNGSPAGQSDPSKEDLVVLFGKLVSSWSVTSGEGSNAASGQSSEKEPRSVIPPPISQEDTNKVKQTITWLKDVKDFSVRVHGLLQLASELISEVFAPKNSLTFKNIVNRVIDGIDKKDQFAGFTQRKLEATQLEARLRSFAAKVEPPLDGNGSTQIKADVDLDKCAKSWLDSPVCEAGPLAEQVKKLASDLRDPQTTGRRDAIAMRLCLLLHAVEILSKHQTFPTKYSSFLDTWEEFKEVDGGRTPTDAQKKSRVYPVDWAELSRCQRVMIRWSEGARAFRKPAATTTRPPWMELANTLQLCGFYMNPPKAGVKSAPRTSMHPPATEIVGVYLQRDQWRSLEVADVGQDAVFTSLELFNALIGTEPRDGSTTTLIEEVRGALQQWGPEPEK